VFHHFGSGALQGASTYLGRDFIVNPLLFMQEWRELAAMGVKPRVFVDPMARVTTPYEMMLNQAAEAKRAAKRHGSCGSGINETVVRDAKEPLQVHMLSPSVIRQYLQRVRATVQGRADELGLGIGEVIPPNEEGIISRWVQDVAEMSERVRERHWHEVFSEHGHVVFEGAQGLRLSEDNVADMPHLTRSLCGLANVAKMLKLADCHEPVDTYYVTRTYVTRHGPGPLGHEVTELPDTWDDTNLHNKHQGRLRWAHLDTDEFRRHVVKDILKNMGSMQIVPHIALTHCDQMQKQPSFYTGGALYERRPPAVLLYSLTVEATMANNLMFFGATRDHVEVAP
jgi:adenylosuccinate synthase